MSLEGNIVWVFFFQKYVQKITDKIVQFTSEKVLLKRIVMKFKKNNISGL